MLFTFFPLIFYLELLCSVLSCFFNCLSSVCNRFLSCFRDVACSLFSLVDYVFEFLCEVFELVSFLLDLVLYCLDSFLSLLESISRLVDYLVISLGGLDLFLYVLTLLQSCVLEFAALFLSLVDSVVSSVGYVDDRSVCLDDFNVALETVSQLEQQMIQRNYKGFLK